MENPNHLQQLYGGILNDITLNELLVELIIYNNDENWTNVVKYCSERDGYSKYVCVERKTWYVKNGGEWTIREEPNMSEEYMQVFDNLKTIKDRAKSLKDIKTVKTIHSRQEAAGDLSTRYRVNKWWFKHYKVDDFDPNEFVN